MATVAGAEKIAETALQLVFNAPNLSVAKIEEIGADLKTLIANIQHESDRVRSFKVDIHWKSRVIHVPRAITATKKLLRDLTIGVKEKIQGLTQPFENFRAQITGEQQLHEAGQSSGKLAQAFQEVENFIAGLNFLIGEFGAAVKTAQNFTDLFDQVISEIEHLDTLFLPQNSARKKTTETYYKRNA